MSAETREPRRFVLVDHSIAGEGGHYLEYARNVLVAAERQGFRPILATNKAFELGDLPWEVHRLYERDVWGRRLGRRPGVSARAELLRSLRAAGIRARLRMKYSRLGLPWMSASAGGVSLSRFAGVPRIQYAPAVLTLPFTYMRHVLRSVVALITATLRPLAASAFTRAATNLLKAILYPVLWSVQHSDLLVRWYRHRQRTNAFATATVSLLRKIQPRRDDIIFIPTLSEADFVGLSHVLRDESSSSVPSWHLLFRRDIYAGREPSYGTGGGDDKVRRALLRATLLEITRRSGRHRVHFYTDTDRLTDQHRRLNATDFSTLPIPVNTNFRPRAQRSSSGPLEIVFLGDARSEKGYPLLPATVDALWRELDTNQVHFTFQSNFGFDRAQADAPVVVARRILELQAPEVVRLLKTPMETSEYERLVLGADIILVPYDAERYYARSSGVLVEALSAGVPVVVPAGSWMSDQIQPEDVAFHDELLAVGQSARRLSERLRWQTFEGDTIDSRRSSTLNVGGGPLGVWSVLRPRVGETHVLVQVRLDEGLPEGMYCRVWLQFMDRTGGRLAKDQAVIGAGADGRASALFEIVAGTEQIEIVLSNAFDPAVITIAQLEIYSLSVRLQPDERIPLAAIGRAYADPEHLASVLREIVASYGDYRERSTAFAARWLERHNPDRLVRELAIAADGASRAAPLVAKTGAA